MAFAYLLIDPAGARLDAALAGQGGDERLARRFGLSLLWTHSPLRDGRRQLIEEICKRKLIGALDEFSGERSGREILDRIRGLDGDARRLADSRSLWHLFVFPREGIISPWSSQASEIAQRAGFDLARLEYAAFYCGQSDGSSRPPIASSLLYDRMVEQCAPTLERAGKLLRLSGSERGDETVKPDHQGLSALDERWGLSLSEADIAHLSAVGQRAGRSLFASEVMMYAQINSEHCRHKLFNARWFFDGDERDDSLFAMIKRTHERSPDNTLEAYHDNAAALAGYEVERWLCDTRTRIWGRIRELTHYCAKVESHNHPTAILPYAGAATGAGGEIRDESATGTGGQPIAGYSGYMVSDLRIPGAERPFENAVPCPAHIKTAYEIMRDAPIGAARCNNEFGRPSLAGFFRTLTARRDGDGAAGEGGQAGPSSYYGYHKPVMLAGGYALMRAAHQKKRPFRPGAPIIALGGPAMLLGLGGGSLSSQANQSPGGNSADRADLDFASVQRSNPEMQRRCHEVLRQCISEGDANPILSIHDVGAGGLANAVSEIVDQADFGARVWLDRIPCLDKTMTPMQIWCNESQERYVLVIDERSLDAFTSLCGRERCPLAVIGEVSERRRMVVSAGDAGVVVDIDLADLIEPRRRRVDIAKAVIEAGARRRRELAGDGGAVDIDAPRLGAAVDDLLKLPAVGSKRFLVTIGDRSVGGLTARDQMVGPFQEPVADVAASRFAIDARQGIAMAIGERAGAAAIDPLAASRMAFAEAITNLLAARVSAWNEIRLSANWMADSGADAAKADLYEAVRTVCGQLAIPLSVSIPVGKDSVSMRTAWQENGEAIEVVSPLTLVITAYARLADAGDILTPYLPAAGLRLLHLPVSPGRHRLGGSAFSVIRPGWLDGKEPCPDAEDAAGLASWLKALAAVRGRAQSYHDISDGGLLVCAAEMAFASRRGVALELPGGSCLVRRLFAEEAGAVLAFHPDDAAWAEDQLNHCGHGYGWIGEVADSAQLTVAAPGISWSASLADLWQSWHETSYLMQSRRDDPACADSERDEGLRSFGHRRGLSARTGFAASRKFLADSHSGPALGHHRESSAPAGEAARPAVAGRGRPKAAILREQGCNGHLEMAWAFDRAGFDAHDVCMQDLLDGRERLDGYQLLAACGGFSFADVLGAGYGWALSVLRTARLRDSFEAFFASENTLSLGVCNGCQFLTQLAAIIPGSDGWPLFGHNQSRQYESRLVMVKVAGSGSPWLEAMGGSLLPIVVAHGEGRASARLDQALIALQYTDPFGQPTQVYPHNPNGSIDAIAGISSADGRVLAMMPHPERLTETSQYSWLPEELHGQPSPWMQLFNNARKLF